MQNFVPTRFRIRKVMILLLLAFLSVYVVYNIFSGDRGLINLRKLKAKHDNLSTEISALQQQKDSSTKQVKQMQNKSDVSKHCF